MLKKFIVLGSVLLITSIILMGCGNGKNIQVTVESAQVKKADHESEKEAIETKLQENLEEQEEVVTSNKTWEYGTTNGNANNLSVLEKRDSIIYFTNYGSNGDLCKMDIAAENNKSWNIAFKPKVLCTGGVNQINVMGDKLYFVRYYYDEAKCEVNSMNTDGSDMKLLYKAPIRNMIVVNEWIYFLNANNYIEKMDINGERHTIILQEECYYLNVYQDKLIFQLDRDMESIYSINIDGSKLMKLNNEPSYEVICDNNSGDIFYTTKSNNELDYTDKVCKMKFDGKQQEVFCEGCFSSLNIQNGNIVAYEAGNHSGFSVIYSEINKSGFFDTTEGFVFDEEGYIPRVTNVRNICISEGILSIFFDVSFSKDDEIVETGSDARMGSLSKDARTYTLKASYSFDLTADN